MRESTGWSFGRDARVGATFDAVVFPFYAECWHFGSVLLCLDVSFACKMRLSRSLKRGGRRTRQRLVSRQRLLIFLSANLTLLGTDISNSARALSPRGSLWDTKYPRLQRSLPLDQSQPPAPSHPSRRPSPHPLGQGLGAKPVAPDPPRFPFSLAHPFPFSCPPATRLNTIPSIIRIIDARFSPIDLHSNDAYPLQTCRIRAKPNDEKPLRPFFSLATCVGARAD